MTRATAARAVIGRRTGLEIRLASLGSTALVRDYLRGDPALAPFYAGFPFDPEAYRRKASAVHARLPAPDRARLAPALEPTSPAAAARMSRVLEGQGLAVTTGQQTGLFGGPLYPLYKVLSAVRLASELEELLGQPVVPVFWVAADDHDWAEVNHAIVASRDGRALRIEVAQAVGAAPVPMSARRPGAAIEPAVEQLLAQLPDSAWAGALSDLVRRAYQPQSTMAEAFRTLFAGLLADLDVVILDPAHPALKRAAAPLLLREIERALSHASILGRQSARLEAAGYHVQVPIAADASNVFVHDEHGRERLVRDGDRWVLRRTKRSFTAAELAAWVERDPSAFSPGVLLRPVVESAVLPTVAYVGGPGELAYFGQIGCLFRAHGVEPPLVVPRASLTLVEPGIRRLLDRFGMEPADFQRPFHELVTERVRASLPREVTAPLAELAATIEAGYDRLMVGARAIDPTLEGWVRRHRNQALAQVESASRKITSHRKKRSGIETAQLGRAAASLAPAGAAQDRALNALPFLARYGPGLVADLRDAIEMPVDRPRPDWMGVVCSEVGTEDGLQEAETTE
jgi:bacillithiol biosynthesis cysteine-adding enzyme BshC